MVSTARNRGSCDWTVDHAGWMGPGSDREVSRAEDHACISSVWVIDGQDTTELETNRAGELVE